MPKVHVLAHLLIVWNKTVSLRSSLNLKVCNLDMMTLCNHTLQAGGDANALQIDRCTS